MNTEDPRGDDPRNDWGSREWYVETLRLNKEIERLTADVKRLREPLARDIELLEDNARLTAALENCCTCNQYGCMTICPACTAVDKPKCQHCAGDRTKPHTNCILR